MLRRDRESVAGHLALLRHLPLQRAHHGALLADSPVRRPLHRHAGKSDDSLLRFYLYRVGHLLADLGWVDLDLECSTIMLGQ